MRFTPHPEVADRHAFLSPSKYSWMRYDEEKLDRVWLTRLAAVRGTEEHEYAAMAIRLGRRQPANGDTLNMYINDCIRWKMTPEVALVGNEHFFGHADAAGFRKNVFRVSDYKSGVTATSMDQPKCYVAAFCMEYDLSPFDFAAEMRIYQNGEIREELADPHEINIIIDRVNVFSKRIDLMRREAFE